MTTFIPARVGGLFWLCLGRWMERKGMSAVAESCYRNVGAKGGKPVADAAFRLSQMLLASDRNREAVAVCEQALASYSKHAQLWCALGAGRRRLAQIDDAAEAYRQAIALEPSYAQAWNNLGEWHLVKGRLEEALATFDKALGFEPNLMQALNNRVAVLYELGRFVQAEEAARNAIDIYPNEAALYANLAIVQLHGGKARLASHSFRKALECDPCCAEAQMGMATLLGDAHRLGDMIEYIEREILLKGESAQRLATLAVAQHAKGDWAATEATCKKVLDMQPGNISALITLAGCMSARADHLGAIRAQEKALEQNPQMPGIYSNLAFESTYLPHLSAAEVYKFHSDWAERFEKAGNFNPFPHDQSRQPDRPLRIGYVSGDFNAHPVGFLVRDVIRHHNRKQFSIYCYSMVRQSDDPVAAFIRDKADAWVEALFMSDDELAKQIHDDRIDILVDLSGHTAFSRLPVFARMPAPIQVSWLGYFHSTGLESIDYFITDPFTTPIDHEQLFSETPVWLPHSRFCYSPPDFDVELTAPPVQTQGRITFGSFNRAEKMVEPVIAAWAEILKAVPGSRLLLKAGGLDDPSIGDEVRARYAAHGIEPARLELRGRTSHFDMFSQYAEIDIALDPFPFNGGMTTLETLWMGIPVIALAGKSVVARQSLSALSNLGLTDLVFDDVDSYVKGAIALAADTARLVSLRQTLRARMLASPLCQPMRFSRDLEALYRRMWQAWCRGEKISAEIVQTATGAENNVFHLHGSAAERKKVRLICGTRASADMFFRSTALGKSVSLYREILPFLELQLFCENSTGLATIYNQAIEYAENDPATLIFIHDDVFLVDFSWADQIELALQKFDIVGVVGNKRRLPRQPAWCFVDEMLTWDDTIHFSGIVGHGNGFPCSALSKYGPPGQECKLLDGVMLIADSVMLLKNQLGFDRRFQFDFYDVDFCRQAELKGLRMGTWPISLIHESTGEFGTASWHESLEIYLEKYGE
ncbi:MAG: tetratricopeptide repeat protein [Burkholderiaceae bacterium]|nr:tetratricopeptide repeat protein [Burkholderiaceae bacterium]